MTRRSHRTAAAPVAEDERIAIAQKAAAYCLMNFPMLWTAGVPVRSADSADWLIPVVLRYPTGHERELGQLSYDGVAFNLLTSRQVMSDRARELEEDPRLRQAQRFDAAYRHLDRRCVICGMPEKEPE